MTIILWENICSGWCKISTPSFLFRVSNLLNGVLMCLVSTDLGLILVLENKEFFF